MVLVTGTAKTRFLLRPPDSWIPARHNVRGLTGTVYKKQGSPEYIFVSEYVRVVKRRKCGRFTIRWFLIFAGAYMHFPGN